MNNRMRLIVAILGILTGSPAHAVDSTTVSTGPAAIGAKVVASVRSELGTPRLDAVSRTVHLEGSSYRTEEPALGRVLCGNVVVETPGEVALTLAEGAQLMLKPGTVVRPLNAAARIVTVVVIPKFEAMIP